MAEKDNKSLRAMPKARRKQPQKISASYIDRSDRSTSLLLNSVSKIPVAENDGTDSLVFLSQEGDTSARQQVISGNIRLVIRIAKDFVTEHNTLDDLVMEGVLGLDEAISHYSGKHNVKFCNYAGWWIRKYIIKYIWKNNLVFYPESVRNKFNKIKRMTDKYFAENGFMPDEKTITDAIGSNGKILLELDEFNNITSHSYEQIDDDQAFAY